MLTWSQRRVYKRTAVALDCWPNHVSSRRTTRCPQTPRDDRKRDRLRDHMARAGPQSPLGRVRHRLSILHTTLYASVLLVLRLLPPLRSARLDTLGALNKASHQCGDFRRQPSHFETSRLPPRGFVALVGDLNRAPWLSRELLHQAGFNLVSMLVAWVNRGIDFIPDSRFSIVSHDV